MLRLDMDFAHTILASFIATSLMTLFSYLYSNFRGSQFKEPELLNILLNQSRKIPIAVSKKNFIGWIIHYAIGLLFVLAFEFIWKFTVLEPSLATGGILGIFAGVIGMSGWKIMFYLNNGPPIMEVKTFYFQLFVAHIIFGLAAGFTYALW